MNGKLTQMLKMGAVLGCAVGLLMPAFSAEAATIRVKCEQRADRSKTSVDGNELVPGMYSARVISGTNQATSAARQAVGDEASFDFDSNANDVAASATAIPANFIQANQVTGQILNSGGNVVVEALAVCRAQ